MLWVVIILGVLLVWYFAAYQRAIAEVREVSNYAILILLDDKVLQAQRDGLQGFVKTTDAKDALELGMKVNLSVAQLAKRLGHTLLGTQGLLWKLRNDATLS
jgi:hypothetical protein